MYKILVIDYCMTKKLVTDSKTNFSSLQLFWASKSSLAQRSGRAGRVMDGRVYRMIYKKNYDVSPNSSELILTKIYHCFLFLSVFKRLLRAGNFKVFAGKTHFTNEKIRNGVTESSFSISHRST